MKNKWFNFYWIKINKTPWRVSYTSRNVSYVHQLEAIRGISVGPWFIGAIRAVDNQEIEIHELKVG